MLTLTIDTDNDAFKTDGHIEVARLLHLAAAKVAGGALTGTLRDTNGNSVGSFTLDLADPYSDAIAAAERKGAKDGLTAASWVFDGNTTAETYRTVLAGLNDGDPAVLDMLPTPNLSGEFADDLTPRTLMEHVRMEVDFVEDDWQDDVCAAYETAFSDAVHSEVERIARFHTTD